jgi:hypothetical protein
MSVTSLDLGLATAEGGVTAPTITATSCHTVNSVSLNGRSTIGDQDRTFSLTQRGSMNLLTGSETIVVEAEAHGTFSEGEAHGTVVFRFVDQPGCDSAPVSWTAGIP